MKRETITLDAPEVRFATDDAGTFTGYASVFGEPDSYGDTVKRGAFRKTLRERKATGGPAMFWNHDSNQPIGVWTELVEDERGLKVTGKLVTETAKGAEALALLKAGAVNGLSIGFRARSAERGAICSPTGRAYGPSRVPRKLPGWSRQSPHRRSTSPGGRRFRYRPGSRR